MQKLSAAQLITLWQEAWSSTPAERALAICSAANQEQSTQEVVSLPIGQRDKCLIDFRQKLFGRQLSFLAECPGCETQIELDLSTKDISFASPPNDSELLSVSADDGTKVSFRLPNSLDLLAIQNASSLNERKRGLLSRCVQNAERDESKISVSELSDVATSAILQAMDEADPQANVEVPLRCVECKNRWSALFDIVSHLWAEIDAWVQKTLNEVHLIASAYGWSESAILSLSPARRQLYVGMLRQ